MFVRFAEILGYSIMMQNTSAERIMMVLSGRDSEDVRQRLTKVGWTIRVVDEIPQPGTPAKDPRFRPLFTKLHVWNMTDTCDRVVMLDLDTLIIKNFDELFYLLPDSIKFGATPDNFYGEYVFGINAGVFICNPDREEFERLLIAKNDTSKYNVNYVEQAFLGYYYKLTMLKLPFIYNANTAIYKFNQQDWFRIEDSIKIIHHTLDKPTGNGIINTVPNSHWYRYEKEFEEWKIK